MKPIFKILEPRTFPRAISLSPFLAATTDVTSSGREVPMAEWPSVSDAISLAFNQVITGTATPEDAAAQAQATIDGIVK